MKKVFLIGMSLICMACMNQPRIEDVSTEPRKRNAKFLDKYIDEELGVVCYRVAFNSPLSCVKLEQGALK